jgi:hypothetical protein
MEMTPLRSIRKAKTCADPSWVAPRTIAILATLALVLCLFTSAALATAGGPGSEDGTGPGDDDLGSHGGRTVDVELGQQRIEVTSTLRAGDKANEIGYAFEAQNRLRIEMQYEGETPGEPAPLRLAVTFSHLIEFEDEDADGIYDPGEEVVSEQDLEGTGIGPLQYQMRTTLDGETEHVITGGTSNGMFRVITHLSARTASTSSGEVSPSWAKIDLEIEGYPYVRTTTRLALMTRVETRNQFSIHQDAAGMSKYLGPGEGGIVTQNQGANAFYSWVRTACVDGLERPVGASAVLGDDGTKLYFAYARGDSITHDPKLGLPLDDTLIDDDDGSFDFMTKVVPYSVAMAGGIAVVGLAIGLRRRRGASI